jgi:hypothetical protein
VGSCSIISLGLSRIPSAENDPLDIARQMAERGITLVSFILSHRALIEAHKPFQFVVACEPELSNYKVSKVQITKLCANRTVPKNAVDFYTALTEITRLVSLPFLHTH